MLMKIIHLWSPLLGNQLTWQREWNIEKSNKSHIVDMNCRKWLNQLSNSKRVYKKFTWLVWNLRKIIRMCRKRWRREIKQKLQEKANLMYRLSSNSAKMTTRRPRFVVRLSNQYLLSLRQATLKICTSNGFQASRTQSSGMKFQRS